MGRLVASQFVTLNGVMEAPENWSSDYFNDEANQFKHDELFAADALLMGRVTYEIFAEAWPSRTDPEGYADRINGLPKFVVSTSLKQAAWGNSTLIAERVSDRVDQLKQEYERDILLFGSEKLLHLLIQQNLIDEFRLMIFPIVLGDGKRLFRNEVDRLPLSLTSEKTISTGVVIVAYVPA
jgi:dihydrofolate reductase